MQFIFKSPLIISFILTNQVSRHGLSVFLSFPLLSFLVIWCKSSYFCKSTQSLCPLCLWQCFFFCQDCQTRKIFLNWDRRRRWRGRGRNGKRRRTIEQWKTKYTQQIIRCAAMLLSVCWLIVFLQISPPAARRRFEKCEKGKAWTEDNGKGGILQTTF